MMHRLIRISLGFFSLCLLLMILGCGSSGESSPEDSVPDTGFSITVELFDGAGNETRTISEGDPGNLRVTVKTSSGALVANQFLEVTTSKGIFLNSDGTAITNSSGVAEFTLVVDGAAGAGIIDVSVGESSLDTPFAFQIGGIGNLKLGTFVNGVFQEGLLASSIASGEKLSIGGTATITASLAYLDGSDYVPYTKSVDISFSTGCPLAVVDETVSTQDGSASTTYSADGCTSESDRVTALASIAGTTLSASVDLLLARLEVGSIAFVSAEPTQIALAGTSNPLLSTTSVITFIVKDEAGNNIPNELVNFSLSTSAGGISISPLSAETNSEGKVQVLVTSGSIPTSVRVHATVNDSQITTVSSNLVISTGFPDQKSFSISASIFNPEALNIDGVSVDVTVRAGDHFNNPVPDGTSISFRTEGGVIDPTCSTVNGACSVQWRSQNPRPENGRVTILATALGEEGFTDANGSGRYESTGDTLDLDMEEAFIDINENSIRDLDEEFLDYNGDLLFTPGNGLYNGTLCVTGCSDELIHVRNSIVLSMSGSSAIITIDPEEITLNALEAVPVTLTVSDINGNSMPSGSTVSLTAPDNATIEGESSFDIPNNITIPSVFTFNLKLDDTSPPGTKSSLQVKVTSPSGTVRTEFALCTTPTPTPTP